MAKKREFWFSAEAERDKDGATWRFRVSRKGRTVFIMALNAAPGSVEHLCHPSNSGTAQGVMHEIGLVYHVSNVRAVPGQF
jgi:hypothetical protein